MTTRGNWGVYVQGTGAFKGSLDEFGFRARLGFDYSGYNYPLTGSELVGAQLPDAPDGIDQIGQIGEIYGYEPGGECSAGRRVGDGAMVLDGICGRQHPARQPFLPRSNQ